LNKKENLQQQNQKHHRDQRLELSKLSFKSLELGMSTTKVETKILEAPRFGS
jgi:hypothetical protein